MDAGDAVLRVEDLSIHFPALDGLVKAVNGVSFSLRRGGTLAIVGESGAGKSTTALGILDLLPYPGQIVGGSVYYEGLDLVALPESRMRQLRGKEISMVFQNAVTGLNPVLTVGSQVAEVLTHHLGISKKEAVKQVEDLLSQLGLSNPGQICKSRPDQLSGGTCQMVMIAIATALRPKVLIADEPTSALDVTMQAMVLDQLRKLKERFDMSMLLITHDLGVVAGIAEDVAVMYAGYLLEVGKAGEVFRRPLSPYTWALMATRPRVDAGALRRLPAIGGAPPDLTEMSGRCPFLPRCNKAVMECRTQPAPGLEEVSPGHYLSCYNPMVAWQDDF